MNDIGIEIVIIDDEGATQWKIYKNLLNLAIESINHDDGGVTVEGQAHSISLSVTDGFYRFTSWEEEAKSCFMQHSIDLLLLDIMKTKSRDDEGFKFLEELRKQNDSTEVIIISGELYIERPIVSLERTELNRAQYDVIGFIHRNILVEFNRPHYSNNVSLFKKNEYFLLFKGLIHAACRRIVRRKINEDRDRQCAKIVDQSWVLKEGEVPTMVGTSPVMQKLRKMIENYAKRDYNVLIKGESGTGKKIVAQYIHLSSSRRSEPCVIVACGSLTPTLAKSELFGHERGAFTGADRSKSGFFDKAGGGTIVLDDIDNLPLDIQAALLEAIDTKCFVSVGGDAPKKISARIIATSNNDLNLLVRENKFRADLLFRLDTLSLTVPLLKDHIGDLPDLILNILQKDPMAVNEEISLTDGAIECLKRYPFPGNIRELQNFVANIITKKENKTVDAQEIKRIIPELSDPIALPDRPRQTGGGICQEDASNATKKYNFDEITWWKQMKEADSTLARRMEIFASIPKCARRGQKHINELKECIFKDH
ncbi:MAG: sigma-54-dependent transcriptional regulator, partial [Mobilitalea sp.]